MNAPSELLPIRAEAFDSYRWAHLLIVGAVHASEARQRPLTLDRLAMYDFFTSHPFLIVETESAAGRRLIREGLEPRSLTYASAPDRLANRRQRIQSDVTALVARDLMSVTASEGRLVCRLTGDGAQTSGSLTSLYAQAVATSGKLIVALLDRVADKTLRTKATEWTSHRALMIDVLEAE